jgi:hypothetical protein
MTEIKSATITKRERPALKPLRSSINIVTDARNTSKVVRRIEKSFTCRVRSPLAQGFQGLTSWMRKWVFILYNPLAVSGWIGSLVLPEVTWSIKAAEPAAGATEAFFVSILLLDIKTG